MSDVFDEDLIKELGLDPNEFNDPGKDVKKDKPVAKPPLPSQKVEKKPDRPPVPPKAQETFQQPVSQPSDRVSNPPPVYADDLEEYGKNLSQDIPVQLVAVLAKKTLALKNILEMKTGEILDFKKMPQDLLDLVVNGKLVAKAELVLVDGRVGARIVKLMK